MNLSGFCTGFIIGMDMIATAAHCVDDMGPGDRVAVYFTNNEMQMFSIIKRGSVDENDYAILAGNTGKRDAVVLSKKEVDTGTQCYSVGYGGHAPLQMNSPCELIPRDIFNLLYLQAAGLVIPGDSGGPAFDSDTGEVIGIVVRTKAPIPIGEFVEISRLQKAIDSL